MVILLPTDLPIGSVLFDGNPIDLERMLAHVSLQLLLKASKSLQVHMESMAGRIALNIPLLCNKEYGQQCPNCQHAARLFQLYV